ncbi:MAG: hypothetical protein L6R38_009178 [Xanthoria sp. 2 TBL-2021]|nr:MAG: hypothetical protein L6R38_009178 [Xanthoria sp. 2 TBL-2021]
MIDREVFTASIKTPTLQIGPKRELQDEIPNNLADDNNTPYVIQLSGVRKFEPLRAPILQSGPKYQLRDRVPTNLAEDDNTPNVTPLSGARKPEPLRADSPSTVYSNVFNKAIFAMNELELDGLFQELVNPDINEDKLRDMLKKHPLRYGNKVAKACRLLRLLFIAHLYRLQSPSKPIAQSDTEGLEKLWATLQEGSAQGKMFVGQDIMARMKDRPSRKNPVDIAQRLGMFCNQFSIGSIFYLVGVPESDKNALANQIPLDYFDRNNSMQASKTTDKTMQPSYSRLHQLNIFKEAKQSGIEKLGEIILTLIQDA